MNGVLILFTCVGLGFGLGVMLMALCEFNQHLDLNGGEDGR